MPRGNYTIQRSCEECGKIFTPPTLVSKYCCPACSKRAYKKRQIAKEKEAIRQALIRRIPSSKGYLTVKEAMLIYGISKDVLYRMIRQGLIPSYNFGQRLIRCGSPSKIIEKDSGLTNFWGSARCCAGRQVTEAHNIPANK